ncbi:MAG: DNA repair ATPase [Luteolibacter sp.]
MAEEKPSQPESAADVPKADGASEALGSATYEIIRQRLAVQGESLRERMAELDSRRAEVFGSIEFKLLQADRIVTEHNCTPRDMVQLGDDRFLFGFNVRFGLKKEMEFADVFAVYRRNPETGAFHEDPLDVIDDHRFLTDFKRLYNVYERTAFRKFAVRDGKLFMIFGTGAAVTDFAAFVWEFNDGNLKFLDGRAEAEFRRIGFPPPHEFRWLKPDRESFRYGDHPHISIEDRVFVECVGGDLTIKVEDNTKNGEGIYSEPVEDRHQKLDDAEMEYAIVDHLIVLKVRPYKEQNFRYFIFNEKQHTVVRADSIGESCVFLPEGHGLIFPDGYYLATGELKQFECRVGGMLIERVIQAPNGEDVMYVFYNRTTGDYALMPYRLIQQRIDERITCHGFSIFPNGHLLLFRADSEPQKHHMIQLRQTPYHLPGYEPEGKRDTFLYQVGNREVVRCLAECNEVLTLVNRDEPYAELYTDLVRRSGAIIDAYPWLSHQEGFEIDAALRAVGEAADRAVDEFDRVTRMRREAVERVAKTRKECELRFQEIRRANFGTLNDYVHNLAALRGLRGELISLREVRYVDVAEIEALENQVVEETATLSEKCVDFLLQPKSLEPYREASAGHLAAVDKVKTVAEGRKIEEAAGKEGAELEMLIEIVNSLRIEDATQTTRIIDGITTVYSTLNQVRSALRNRLSDLAATEGKAQFAAQMKLLGQAASSYLDLCDTPAKCDEYLNRLSVQIEELEGRFAGFDEFTLSLAERRTELYEAFEQRKVALVEERNRRANSLGTAAERILKVISNRLEGFKTLEEINAYMASDMMVSRIRETVAQLLELGDVPRADGLDSKLKSTQQEAVRRLKDRQDLFADGENVIRLGKHAFNVSTQPLDLTVVLRESVQHVHITGTHYFDPITDDEFVATRDVWDQEIVSETRDVYRAEYLAWQMLKAWDGEALPDDEKEVLEKVRQFMGPRYVEGYTRGIHDLDGAKILTALVKTTRELALARAHPVARAMALVWWHRFCPEETRTLWSSKLTSFAQRNKLFPGDPIQGEYIATLQKLLRDFADTTGLYPAERSDAAGEYLFHQLVAGWPATVTREADQLVTDFHRQLSHGGAETTFADGRAALTDYPASELSLIRDWLRGFIVAGVSDSGSSSTPAPDFRHHEEACALIFCGDALQRSVVTATTTHTLKGMKGAHARMQSGNYTFDHLDFHERLQRHEREVVPRYEAFNALKQARITRERNVLKLDEFKPKVFSAFVRNQLIDDVYLPLIGDNLAKQIGAAGDNRRTDLSGLLLVISPPGYGKTTLLEYIADRLGIAFIKINGPALGHNVVSLDPEEAPNANARSEINKLNLALEMGDNAMICIDDIQHCNPEFLQKFISLCDGQRRIEGIWRGRSRTYDLRGRKIAVVMAGNPYTESGTKFQIPDMLANRADTYNLGDIIGSSANAFKASYLENAVTSNPALVSLANKSQKDVRAFIRIAETGQREGVNFEASYSSREIDEILSILTKLVAIRDVVLKVNQQYIHSAAQSDEFRTEPPFRLQGSYRNMNRMTEKVVAIMNDAEVRGIILDHYRGESQTLTTGTEANFLKFKEIIGDLTEAEQKRWNEIKTTFQRNTVARGTGGEDDPVGRVVAQLHGFQTGLEGIRGVLTEQISKPAPAPPEIKLDFTPIGKAIDGLRKDLAKANAEENDGGKTPPKLRSVLHELEMMHSTLATLKDLAAAQRDHLDGARRLLDERARQGSIEIEVTQDLLANEAAFLEHFHTALANARAGK